VLRRAKGYYLSKSTNYRIAKQQVEHSLAYAYRDRRARKRSFRRLWIVRIGAASKEVGLSYGRLIRGLKVAGVALDRKSLADVAIKDPGTFRSLCELARSAAPPAGGAAPA
jgi:large subunit ribosomal protein L20